MCVAEVHLEVFPEAIVSFWEAIPRDFSVVDGITALDLPAFYAKAMRLVRGQWCLKGLLVLASLGKVVVRTKKVQQRQKGAVRVHRLLKCAGLFPVSNSG